MVQPPRRDRDTAAKLWFLAFVGIVAFTAMGVRLESRRTSASVRPTSCVGVTILLLAAIPVTAGGWFFLRDLLSRARCGRPELLLSSTQPRLGADLAVSLRLQPRFNTLLRRVVVALVCEETFARGGDSGVRELHRMEQVVAEGVWANPGTAWDGDCRFTLGRELPATIPPETGLALTTRPSIEWSIEVRLEVPWWPALCESYGVQVMPPADA